MIIHITGLAYKPNHTINDTGSVLDIQHIILTGWAVDGDEAAESAMWNLLESQYPREQGWTQDVKISIYPMRRM